MIIMMIISLLSFALSYEGLSAPLRYSGGAVRIFNAFLTRFEVWRAWAIKNIKPVIVGLILVAIVLLTINNMKGGDEIWEFYIISATINNMKGGGRIVDKTIEKGNISPKLNKEVHMSWIIAPTSPLSIMVEKRGGRLFLADEDDIPDEGVVILPARPTDAIRGRRLFIIGEKQPADRIVKSVNRAISQITGVDVDIRKLAGKRIKDLVTPEIANKGMHPHFSRLKKGMSRVMNGAFIPKNLGIDGVGFISTSMAEKLALLYAPSKADVPYVLRRIKKNGVKLSLIGGKGVFYVVPPNEVGAIKFLRMFLNPDDVEEVLRKINGGADIILDVNTAKLIRKEKFSLSLGRTVLLHELGGFFSPGISASQTMMRWFVLPKICGLDVKPAAGIIERYRSRLQTAFDAVSDPDAAADIVAAGTGHDPMDLDPFMNLLETILRGFGFAEEIEGTIFRVIFNALKIRSRKIEMGASEYLTPSLNVTKGTVVVNPFVAKISGIESGDFVVVQKSPILPGDTIILKAVVKPAAVGIMVNPHDLPSGWDGDGDKAVVIKGNDVFQNIEEAKAFFDELRHKIEGLHPEVHSADPKDEATILADGKRWISTADAGLTRFFLDVLARGEKVSVDDVALASSTLQVAINFSNGKVPEDVDIWRAKVEGLASFNSQEVSGLLKEMPFLDIITVRGHKILESHIEYFAKNGIALPEPLTPFTEGVEVKVRDGGESISIIDALKIGDDDDVEAAPLPIIKKIFSSFEGLGMSYAEMKRKQKKLESHIAVKRVRLNVLRIMKFRTKSFFENSSEESRKNFLFSPIKSERMTKREIEEANEFLKEFERRASNRGASLEEITNRLIPLAESTIQRNIAILNKKINVLFDGYMKNRSTVLRELRSDFFEEADPEVVIATFRKIKRHIPKARTDHSARVLQNIVNSFVDIIAGTPTGDYVDGVAQKLIFIKQAVQMRMRVWELAGFLNISWKLLANHHFKVVDEGVAKKAKSLVINCGGLPDPEKPKPKGGGKMEKRGFTLSFTGHRPQKLKDVDYVEKEIRGFLEAVFEEHPDIRVLTGGALGVDQIAAKVCYEMGIPFDVVLPFSFDAFTKYWTSGQRDYAKSLFSKANNLIELHDKFSMEFYQERNEYLVDNCDILCAVFNGTPGGTANCVKYAKKVGRKIVYINPDPDHDHDLFNNNKGGKEMKKKEKTIIIHVDGSRSNAGVGCGVVINGKSYHYDLPDDYTHNQAEITALYKAALLLKKYEARLHPYDKIIIYTDSQLVANQYNGNWKIKKDGFRQAYAKIHAILDNLPAFLEVIWVPREENEEADTASKASASTASPAVSSSLSSTKSSSAPSSSSDAKPSA